MQKEKIINFLEEIQDVVKKSEEEERAYKQKKKIVEEKQPFFTRSSVFLIVANLITVLGVLIFKWDVFAILLMYWTETVIIGLINIPKIFLASKKEVDLEGIYTFGPILNFISRTFYAVFFILHFGAFLSVLLMVIFGFFGMYREISSVNITLASAFFDILKSNTGILIGVFTLSISHIFSFFTNYISKKEYKNMSVDMVTVTPYKRLYIMYLTIFLSAFPIIIFGQHFILVIVMMMLKTMADLASHKIEHSRKFVTITTVFKKWASENEQKEIAQALNQVKNARVQKK